MTSADIADLVAKASEKAIATRRDLHMHPELGLTEFRTASIVARRLADLGLDVQTGTAVMDPDARVGLPPEEELERCYQRAAAEGADPEFLPHFAGGNTGVVGILKGGKPGPVTAIRVDMDALPILEDDTQAHRPHREGFGSKHRGVMHSCGHDFHTALGLGVAEVMSSLKNDLHGTLKFIFQPAEEGGRGALPMVKAGIVDDVDRLIAVHVGTGVPSRTFQTAVYGHLASVKLDVTFRGRAAHAGGRPEEGRNALVGAAQAVLGLYAISRHHAGASRVNVGTLHAGSGRNVIADEAKLIMEVRGETEAVADYMVGRARSILEGAALAHDLEVEIVIAGRTTTAASDESLGAEIAEAASGLPGVEIEPGLSETMGSEDATFLMQRVQEKGGRAVYAIIGSDLASGHHTPDFDIEESDMPWAIEALARTALSFRS